MRWMHFTKCLEKHIENTSHVGVLEGEDVFYSEGDIRLSFCVDTAKKTVKEAKFLLFGPAILVGIVDALCSFVIDKRLDRVYRMRPDLLESLLRDHPSKPSISDEDMHYVHQVLEAMMSLLSSCPRALLATTTEYAESPIDCREGVDTAYSIRFVEASKEEKIALLQAVMETDVQPYVSLDEGGVTVVDIQDGFTVIVRYSGACTTCYAATGSTLQAIGQILRMKVHPDIQVQADLSSLQLSNDTP